MRYAKKVPVTPIDGSPRLINFSFFIGDPPLILGRLPKDQGLRLLCGPGGPMSTIKEAKVPRKIFLNYRVQLFLWHFLIGYRQLIVKHSGDLGEGVQED
jgi:hypothetical protein